MTAANLRDCLLPMLGVESIDDATPQAATEVLAVINRSLREIYALGPDHWLGNVPRGELLRAPTTVTIGAVTQDSKAITFSGYASWMAGCSIRIAGDATINRLTASDGSGVSLVLPYGGSSGTNVSATVYHDALNLDSAVVEVVAPLMLEDQWELRPVSKRSRMSMQFGTLFHPTDHGIQRQLYPLLARDKQVTRPTAFSTDEPNLTYNTDSTLRLVFDTFPDQRYRVSFSAKTIARVTDIAADTRTSFLPFGYDETILRPWVRWNFRTFPHVLLTERELQSDYDAAITMLGKMHGQQFEETRVDVTGGW